METNKENFRYQGLSLYEQNLLKIGLIGVIISPILFALGFFILDAFAHMIGQSDHWILLEIIENISK